MCSFMSFLRTQKQHNFRTFFLWLNVFFVSYFFIALANTGIEWLGIFVSLGKTKIMSISLAGNYNAARTQ